ncbi:MAG: metallophosphoesterase [Acidobacteriota bacterium]
MSSILHVSDVHFGPPHRGEVAEGILRLIEERQPDLVVISGDLTQRAKPEQFQACRRWVDRIAVPTLAVPGNHDVPLWPVPRLWERLMDPLGAYRRHFSADLEPVFSGAGLLVAGINTAYNFTTKHGRFLLPRLREVAEIFATAPPEVTKVVVAHHHLVPPPGFGSQRVSTNSYEAMDVFTAAGVDLVLSGHNHHAYVYSSEQFYRFGRPSTLIVHSGTSCSSRGRAIERGRNTCYWLRVEDEAMGVDLLQWEDGEGSDDGRFVERSCHRLPRRQQPFRVG